MAKLNLSVAQQAILNLSLDVTSVEQEVTVTAISPLLDQETAGLGGSRHLIYESCELRQSIGEPPLRAP